MNRLLALGLLLLCLTPAQASPPEVRVFVALADNASQGLVPVPARIGNGDDPTNNLYWGCADALPNVFGSSKDWKRVATTRNPAPAVLERQVFDHRSAQLRIVADAYRGSAIQQCTLDFFAALRSNEPVTNFLLAVYIGHDGLMDFHLPAAATAARGPGRSAIVLCCQSERYFGPPLQAVGARPLLLTTQLMYPGAFILHAVLEGWVRGEAPAELRERAAQSYAANQKLALKAARGVFSAHL